MGPILFLLFIVVPIVELVLLIWIGTKIGFWPTAGIVVATGLLGAVLAPMQGARAWREIVTAWQAGRVPGAELIAGALFLVGAAFLITPGVITDAVGILLMLPFLRAWLSRGFLRYFKRRARVFPQSRVVEVRRVE